MPELSGTLMELAGVVPVILYLLGTQPEDLTPALTLSARGFAPKAQALVLNEVAMDRCHPGGGLRPDRGPARVRQARTNWHPGLDATPLRGRGGRGSTGTILPMLSTARSPLPLACSTEQDCMLGSVPWSTAFLGLAHGYRETNEAGY